VPIVPLIRIRQGNRAPIRGAGRYILYWMISSRRLKFNFALDHAVERAHELRKPLLILEPLRCDYPWASARLHRFVLDGMADHAKFCDSRGILYYPYVEPSVGAGAGLLSALATDACLVVADDYPCFFLPKMISSAAERISVRLEIVDSNGMLPLRVAGQAFSTAYAFRRFLQKTLPAHLGEFPSSDPLAKKRAFESAPGLPESITSRWSRASPALLSGRAEALAALPIDHSVPPAENRGGDTLARAQMQSFVERKLSGYGEQRNEPDLEASSGLSPYLHFGQISVHEVFREIAERENWKPEKLSLRSNGSRGGWWNMTANAEAFLDELITWRELGFNFCAHRTHYDRYESLPKWSRKTLKEHERDERTHVYTLEEFETARTHDALWNAAQTQLTREGRIHNYLRMLWGKKILEWTSSPQEAIATLVQLNNKYALDGRDPNSYSGIFWCLGRYDRPWGPERPIFGTVRYMSSENTVRKFSVKNYLRKYGGLEKSTLLLI